MTIRLLHTSERFSTHYGNSSGSHVPSRSNYVNLFVKKFFHWTLVVYLSLETMDSHYVDMNNLEFPLCERGRRKTLFNESFSRNLDHSSLVPYSKTSSKILHTTIHSQVHCCVEKNAFFFRKQAHHHHQQFEA